MNQGVESGKLARFVWRYVSVARETKGRAILHPSLRYIQGYPAYIVEPVSKLIDTGRLIGWFDQRYPTRHDIRSEKALFDYAMAIKTSL